MSQAIRTKKSTVSSSVVAISAVGWGWTAGDLEKATGAWISATQPVMYTFDGATDPTTAIGHPIAAGGTVFIPDGRLVRALRFLRTSGTDADVTVSLLKE